MLVLKRQEGEAIVIKNKDGSVITVRLLEYLSKDTKIGIEAPTDILILREELNEK